MTALDKNRVNHAYLFSGPRGCGKTTSARILARCLNCAKGPTSHPCGECSSCVELARGGTGSLDVIEIDAASHGGVDDARDLRERATFAPIRDRYKIFIIDEAHMVTSAGFNALLKIVEEPPEHIKFIFATTEPDKVIGTIRSRTHHYPFRLVPPEPLMAYLAQLCEKENVAVAPGVLSLVVRAGGGSVRDSLSVLDQLMAGAGATGLDYDLAVDLLGYTHSSLLDDVVEALAANDSATVFKSVDRVIQTGHDPRRFVEDLLERFRDLIIVHAMPESAHAILRGTPDELIARMQTQAAQLGAAELSRAADVTNAAFNEMTGATSPRLHLELLGARLLLPGADSSVRGMATRLDQLERRINYAGTPNSVPAGTPAVPATPHAAPEHRLPVQSSTPVSSEPTDGATGMGLAAVRAQLARAKEAAGAEVEARQPSTVAHHDVPESSPIPSPTVVPAQAQVPEQAPVQTPDQRQAQQPARTWDELPTPASNTGLAGPETSVPQQNIRPEQGPQSDTSWSGGPAAPPSQPVRVEPQQAQPLQPQNTPLAAPSQGGASGAAPSAAPSAAGSSGIEVIRRAWPEILGSLRKIRMASWVIVNQNVVPQTFDGKELRVGLPSTGLISAFSNGGHLANLQQAINEVLGLTIQILPVDGEAPAPRASAEPNPKVHTGNPSPQSEGSPNHASPSGATLLSRESDTAATLPASPAAATVSHDSWGLPTTQPSLPTSPPLAQAAPDSGVAATDNAPVDSASATPTTAPTTSVSTTSVTKPAVDPAPWDGPTEPSDPWDEPYPDSYPSADPYESTPYPSADPYQSATSGESGQPQRSAYTEPAALQDSEQPVLASGESATPGPPAATVTPPAHTPPKVSPISAWTTGWDAPVTEPVSAAPTAPEAPRRSALLAEQAAQQSTQPAPQDWGVSLGQSGRSEVSDPGWGSMSTAPDWAQAESLTPAVETASCQRTPSVVSPADSSEPTGTGSGVASSNSVTQAPAPENAPAQVVVAEQEAPASDMAESAAKMSLYQRLANSSEAQAGRAQAPALAVAKPYVQDVPSPDDVTIEESGVVGQAAVERILGGVLIEERPLNPSS